MKAAEVNPKYVMSETVIHGVRCEIWNCEAEHDYGKMNKTLPCVWVKFKDDFYPWLWGRDLSPCWGLELNQGHSIKYKYGDADIRGGTYGHILCNGRKVYEIRTGRLSVSFAYALAKVSSLIVEMEEHPFNFVLPETEIGRKVYYQRQPAIVERLVLDQGAVIFRYDGEGQGFDMKDPWSDESWPSEWDGEATVKDDILRGDIWWFRKEDGHKPSDGNHEITEESQ